MGGRMRRGFRRLVLRTARHMSADELAAPAVVFSPHPDDETLGCGGTIARKLQAGAAITVVFMTDGSRSHSKLMARDKLGALRKAEALAATGQLGLSPDDVVFFDYPDQNLTEHATEAVARAEEIIRQRKPVQIFAPFRNPLHPDHMVTNNVVRQALANVEKGVVLYEFPIWFWNQWPWVAMHPPGRRHIPRLAMAGLSSAGRAVWNFRRAVNIAPVAETKRQALMQYRSQMTRLMDDPNWHTLDEVAGGQLLECLLDGREVFTCVRV